MKNYPILCKPGNTPKGHLVLMKGNDVAVVSDGRYYPNEYYDYGPVPSQKEEKQEIVFHFNKAHLADPTIPMWVIKSKGETFYINHVEFENVSFSTKETPNNPHTKGSLKFKKVNLALDKERSSAIIYGGNESS